MYPKNMADIPLEAGRDWTIAIIVNILRWDATPQ